MEVHVFMSDIEHVAAELACSSVGKLLLLFRLELISLNSLRLFDVLFGQLLSCLELHLWWVFGAHFANCVNEALLAGCIEEILEVEAADAELSEIWRSIYFARLNVVDDLVTWPLSVLVRVQIEATNWKVSELFERPPAVWHFLQLIFRSKEQFFWHFVKTWLPTHSQWDIQSARIPDNELEGRVCTLLQLPGNGVLIFLKWNNINKIYPPNDTTSKVPVRKLRHIVSNKWPVEICVHFLKMVNLFLRRFLWSSMNPKCPSVLIVPSSAFEPFESVNEEGRPWLMHREAHANVILLSIESLVLFENSCGLLRFLYHCTFDRLPELFKRILCLEPQAKWALLEFCLILRWLLGLIYLEFAFSWPQPALVWI